tara:strand:+ start:747 stop:1382 length:636 start_codon:yes stop_codon:yes gene_type:complete
MKNLIFMFLAITIFFGCEEKEDSNDTPDFNLVGNWNVNLEIFEGSSGCNGSPDLSLSGTLIFTETTITTSMNYMGYSYNANFNYTLNSSNNEISMSLDNSLQTFTNCFSGNDTYGPCSTCGFYDSEEDAQGDYDCITCPEGYEIDVYFDDCTGYCVPNGTAQNPISDSDCVSPNEPQVGSLELDESSATIEMLMGVDDDSYCERWNLTRAD